MQNLIWRSNWSTKGTLESRGLKIRRAKANYLCGRKITDQVARRRLKTSKQRGMQTGDQDEKRLVIAQLAENWLRSHMNEYDQNLNDKCKSALFLNSQNRAPTLGIVWWKKERGLFCAKDYEDFWSFRRKLTIGQKDEYHDEIWRMRKNGLLWALERKKSSFYCDFTKTRIYPKEKINTTMQIHFLVWFSFHILFATCNNYTC